MDTISELAEMAFASRLKRLSERLMKDVSSVYKKLNFDFEARWFTILYALNRQSPITVTKLAKSLRLTHPAVNQLTGEMIKKGLVRSSKGKKDERTRFLSISAKGKRMAEKLGPVWKKIKLANQEVLLATGTDLISGISKLEAMLDEKSMYERVLFHLIGEIKILDYRPAWKKHFKALNEEWLEEYFQVEKRDQKLLSDPKAEILDPGGAILFAQLNKKIVGTCALLKKGDHVFELAKMGVTKDCRNLGLGKALLQAAIQKARDLGADSLYLLTNSNLKAANVLYKKFGFRKITKIPFDPGEYKRTTFAMKLNLKLK